MVWPPPPKGVRKALRLRQRLQRLEEGVRRFYINSSEAKGNVAKVAVVALKLLAWATVVAVTGAEGKRAAVV